MAHSRTASGLRGGMILPPHTLMYIGTQRKHSPPCLAPTDGLGCVNCARRAAARRGASPPPAFGCGRRRASKTQQQTRRAEQGSGGRSDRLRARASGDEEADEGGGSWRVEPGRWSRFGTQLKAPPAHWLQELCFQALTVICKYNLMNKLALCVCVCVFH